MKTPIRKGRSLRGPVRHVNAIAARAPLLRRCQVAVAEVVNGFGELGLDLQTANLSRNW